MKLALLLLPFPVMAQAPSSRPAVNQAADPCIDFYRYACGTCIAHNPLPSDRARFGRFTELSEHNERGRAMTLVLTGVAAGLVAARSDG